MNKFDILFDDASLDSFSEKLAALPERIRDENNGRYCYPEQFQNKCFRLGNKFLLFNSSSYEEISFDHVKFLINVFSLLLDKLKVSNKVSDSLNEEFNKLKTIVEEKSQLLDTVINEIEPNEKVTETLKIFEESINSLREDVEAISSNPISESSSNIDSSNIDNIQKQLNEITTQFNQINKDIEIIKEFKSLKEKLNSIITNYEKDNSEFKSQLDELNHQIAKINPTEQVNEEQLINVIGKQIWERIEPNLTEVQTNTTLPVEYQSFKKNIEDTIENILSKIAILSQTPTVTTIASNVPDKLEKLCELKKAGYSVDEIITLKNNSLL